MRHLIHPQPAPPRRGGFTLVELTLTLVIVGLVAAVAVPRYANALTRYKADAAARRVVADIQHARAHAKANSADTTLWFRVNMDRVRIPSMPGLDNPAETYLTKLADEPYVTNLTAADFGGDEYLVFDGYGRPDSGGSLTLRRGRIQRIITVDPDTGEASIQ